MSILEAIVLGIVQGLTEFLPISSTAHLRIVPSLLGWAKPSPAFEAVVQCGTLAALVAVMWRDIHAIALGFLSAACRGRPLATPESRAGLFIVVGTLPIVVAGLAGKDWIKGPLRSLESIAAALALATVAMIVAEWLAWRRSRAGASLRGGLESLRLTDGLVVGCAQALALIPGTSRSGITISAGMVRRLDRRTAARFSFLLSLPAIAAAAVLELVEEWRDVLGTPQARAALVWGTLAAAVTGYAAIRWLLRLLTSQTLWPFIAYRIVLAAVLLAWLLAGQPAPTGAAGV